MPGEQAGTAFFQRSSQVENFEKKKSVLHEKIRGDYNEDVLREKLSQSCGGHKVVPWQAQSANMGVRTDKNGDREIRGGYAGESPKNRIGKTDGRYWPLGILTSRKIQKKYWLITTMPTSKLNKEIRRNSKTKKKRSSFGPPLRTRELKSTKRSQENGNTSKSVGEHLNGYSGFAGINSTD